MRLGVVVLPEYPWPVGARIWRRVEDLGADHAWTFDHLSWRSLRGRPWFDAMTTLAAAAADTRRMALGVLVTSPNFRHPLLVARQAMTLDHLSGGRFVLGVGAGALGADATALGGPPLGLGARASRFEEFVGLTDLLLRQPATTFRGRYFDAVDVQMAPGCVQLPRVPFAIAAAGPRGMRLAARYAATWVTVGDPGEPGSQPEAVAFGTLRTQLARLAQSCRDVGRDWNTLRRLVNISRLVADPYTSSERFAELVGRCADLGFTDVVVNFPRPHGVFAGDRAAFEAAVTGLTRAAHAQRSR